MIRALPSLKGNLEFLTTFSKCFEKLQYLCLDCLLYFFPSYLGDSLTDESIQPLVSVIQQGVLSNLRSLYVRDNQIEDKGMIQLLDTLNENCSVLRSLGLSCSLVTFH